MSWGGQCVDYPERRHCCGFGFRNYLVQANRGYSVANSHKKLESMAPYKPDFIVANCPGCAMFLDKWQYAIAEMEGTSPTVRTADGIPVLTYEEMAGLVLGYDPWELGMQMHQVDVEPLLDKMGIDYDPAAKYLGRHGKFIGKPASFGRQLRCSTDMIYDIRGTMKREVIIVGGGVAGMQTALRLADRGIRPTIVEKESDLGGKLRGWYHAVPVADACVRGAFRVAPPTGCSAMSK